MLVSPTEMPHGAATTSQRFVSRNVSSCLGNATELPYCSCAGIFQIVTCCFVFFVTVWDTASNSPPVSSEKHGRIGGQAFCKLFKVPESEEKNWQAKKTANATLTPSSAPTRGTRWTAKTNMLSLLRIWSQTSSSVCPTVRQVTQSLCLWHENPTNQKAESENPTIGWCNEWTVITLEWINLHGNTVWTVT